MGSITMTPKNGSGAYMYVRTIGNTGTNAVVGATQYSKGSTVYNVTADANKGQVIENSYIKLYYNVNAQNWELQFKKKGYLNLTYKSTGVVTSWKYSASIGYYLYFEE